MYVLMTSLEEALFESIVGLILLRIPSRGKKGTQELDELLTRKKAKVSMTARILITGYQIM